ncbi:hypothetical protein Kpho02_03450 [Kitasatospora phosalacinea]|uniref:Uncharacterized protein n=1 Tax=Kitasatospora phosalacinea TaxID=2065 RepID=A0A9W6Q3W9_9ACTN|nr:hypothetical protein [Kitasatospora phosalacinea]GLW68046.1 hypothetical protein Kpho02_03450 [Kitasatospora phosalacinea]
MARAEGGGRWYVRLAARYLLGAVLFWSAVAVLFTALTGHALADSVQRCLPFLAFCAVFPVLLAPVVPLRSSPRLRWYAGTALVLPLLPLLLLFGPFPLPLAALHLAFARWLLPRPVLLLR